MGATSDIFLTDAQIAKRLDMSAPQWEATARALEKNGLPRRDPLFQDRRCWPAVFDFLMKRAAAGASAFSVEHENAFKRKPPAVTDVTTGPTMIGASRKRVSKPIG